MTDTTKFINQMIDSLDLAYITYLTEEHLEDTHINRAGFYTAAIDLITADDECDPLFKSLLNLRLAFKIMTLKNLARIELLYPQK